MLQISRMQAQLKGLVIGLLGLGLALGPHSTSDAKGRINKESGLAVTDVKIVGETHAPLAFQVEIADNVEERATGLMYRRELPPSTGMLFEFDDEDMRSFWMRNTYLPLDIIFVDGKGVIVSIQKQARPFDETPLPSSAPARAVLEIGGGLSDRLGIRTGDRIEHPFFKAH